MDIKLGSFVRVVFTIGLLHQDSNHCLQQVSNEHLITLAISSNPDTNIQSAAVLVTPRNERGVTIHDFPGNQRLSRGCRGRENNFFAYRCRRLMVINSTTVSTQEKFIVVAPLQNAIGLMELVYNGASLLQGSTAVLTTDDCVPLEIINIGGVLVLFCMGLRTLYSREVRLKYTSVSRSYLRSPVRLYTFPRSFTDNDYQFVSNFMYTPDVRNQVLFLAQGHIFGIRLDRGNVQVYSGVDNSECDRIVYGGDHILYAYCSSGKAVRYNIDERVSRSLSLNGSGIQYACPTSEHHFKVQQSTHDIQITHSDAIASNSFRFHSTGTDFLYGECLMKDSVRFFVFLDAVQGVSVFNATSRRLLDPISSSLCSRESHCEDLMVFEGLYFVVQKANEVIVFNSSFLPIIQRPRVAAGALTLLTNLRTRLIVPSSVIQLPATSSVILTSPSSIMPPTTASNMMSIVPRNTRGLTIAIVLSTSILGIIIIILSLVTIIVPITICVKKRCRKQSTGPPSPSTMVRTTSRPSIPGIENSGENSTDISRSTSADLLERNDQEMDGASIPESDPPPIQTSHDGHERTPHVVYSSL